MLYNVHVKNKITERRREKSNDKQTPLSPKNEINKPTVGGISDGKEIL